MKPEPRPSTAQQRVQAVLSIWTERRRRDEICQELAITPRVLSLWEQRAVAGMLKALESQTRLEGSPALSSKLERLLAQQAARHAGRLARLDKRLAKLQEPKVVPSPPK
jgi:replicative superfamily II helicase